MMASIFLVIVVHLSVRFTTGVILGDSDPLAARVALLEYNLMQAMHNNTILQYKVSSLYKAIAECNCQSTETAHPAFMAKVGSRNTTCYRDDTLIFDSVDLDSEYSYSGTKGVFTAPVSGNYAFNVDLSTAPSDRFHIVLVKNISSNIIEYLFSGGDKRVGEGQHFCRYSFE